MSRSSTITLLGGVGSGKTTYLGALIDTLESACAPGLKLKSLPPNARALELLPEPLRNGKYPQRTTAERHILELPLRVQIGTSAEELTLTAGDYDGEDVERLFNNRTSGFSEEWRARAHARGLLLFLRRDAITPLPNLRRRSMTDAERFAALRGEAPADEPATPEASSPLSLSPERVFGPGVADEPTAPSPAAPDEPVRVPTALAMIELLQFLRHVRGLAPAERPPVGQFRVAILLSAWDAVDRSWHAHGPRAFLREQEPLLDDFLWSNFHDDDVFCFGLSSTSGDLRNPAHRERYIEDMHGFVEWSDVTGRVHRTQNLALPVAWVIAGDRALALDETLAQS